LCKSMRKWKNLFFESCIISCCLSPARNDQFASDTFQLSKHHQTERLRAVFSILLRIRKGCGSIDISEAAILTTTSFLSM
jgi:hypothetical protein